MIGCIYAIQNKVNGKLYIGKHEGDDLQKYLHINILRAKRGETGKRLLFKAFLKYGFENFTIHQVYVSDSRHNLNKAEVFFIRFFGTRNTQLGYNLAEGGSGGNTREGYKNSTKHIEAIRAALTGVPKSEEHKKKLSLAKIGIKSPQVSESNRRRRSSSPTPAALINRRYRERKKSSMEAFLNG